MPHIGTSAYSVSSISSSESSDIDEEFKAGSPLARPERQARPSHFEGRNVVVMSASGGFPAALAQTDGAFRLIQRYRLHAIAQGYCPPSAPARSCSLNGRGEDVFHDTLAQRARILGYFTPPATASDTRANARVASDIVELISDVMSGKAERTPDKCRTRAEQITSDIAIARTERRTAGRSGGSSSAGETVWDRLGRHRSTAPSAGETTGGAASGTGWLESVSRSILADYSTAINELESVLHERGSAGLEDHWDRLVQASSAASAPRPGRSPSIPMPFSRALETPTTQESLRMLQADSRIIASFSSGNTRSRIVDGENLLLTLADEATDEITDEILDRIDSRKNTSEPDLP